MRKPFAFALMLAAAMGLAACDKASEDKAQDAQEHAEQAQEKMGEAQDKMNDAAKENAEAAKDQAEAEQKAAEEAARLLRRRQNPPNSNQPDKKTRRCRVFFCVEFTVNRFSSLLHHPLSMARC